MITLPIVRSRSLFVAVVGVLASASTALGNITMDFESLTQSPVLAGSGTAFLADSYSESGFNVKSSAFASWEAGSSNYAGSTALFAMFDTDTVVLSRDNGGVFNLDSIDLSEAFTAPGPGAGVNFVGTRRDGSQVQEFVAIDGQFGFETHSFTGFNDLVSVQWQQGTTYHQFDNLSMSVVPVPGAVFLGLVGLGVVSWVRRRR